MSTAATIDKSQAIAGMSIEELQAALKEKQAEEQKEKLTKRKSYENRKEQLINELGDFACVVRDQMADLKYEAFKNLTTFRQEMLEYGHIRRGENNKGSFQLKNDNFKIEFSSQVNKCFDERAEMAEAKLKEFLASFVKKKDRNAYDLIITLLERNSKTGDFDFDLINRLYKMKDRFQNPLWVEALDMFMESYSPYGTAQYIKFSIKNKDTNAFEPLVLDFAKLKSTPHHEPAEENPEP